MAKANKDELKALDEAVDDSDYAFARMSLRVSILDVEEMAKSDRKRAFVDEKGYFEEMQEGEDEGMELISSDWNMTDIDITDH